MMQIYRLAVTALRTGWLSLETEERIKQLLDIDGGWCTRDLEMLSELQIAVSDGRVEREAIERVRTASLMS